MLIAYIVFGLILSCITVYQTVTDEEQSYNNKYEYYAKSIAMSIGIIFFSFIFYFAS